MPQLAISTGDASENRLVRAAQAGSREAFDSLRHNYERPLRGFLARKVVPGAVDDLLQETWLASWIALPRFSRRSRFKVWLFGIAVHKCHDYYRSRGRAVESPLDEVAESLADTRDRYAQTDTQQVVRDLLRGLPEEQREVIEMYYYAELTLAEIGEALGRNTNTVKSQFYRAHAQCAQALEQNQAIGQGSQGRKV